jgi:gamma-glutamyltranspeptidase
MSYSTTIPRHIGLAGSSAIITAAFNCLLDLYDVNESLWPVVERPSFILQVEKVELGIAAGLMDRVAQVLAAADYGRKSCCSADLCRAPLHFSA